MPWPTFSASTRLLVVAPHPDDETLACGVLMQQVRDAGGTVHILQLTDGDNNPWPQRWLERRWWIGAQERLRWGRRRRAEVAQAVAKLGLPASALQSLGWPDMGLTGQLVQDPAGAMAVLGAAIDAFEPNLVALPALEDRHPDHGAAHVLCRLAFDARDLSPAGLAYPVHGQPLPGAVMLATASSGQQQAKLDALREHVTQMTLSGDRLLRLATRPEQFVPLETGASTPEAGPLPWCPPRWLQPFLRVLVADAAGVTDHAWGDVVVAGDGGYRLSLARRASGSRFAKLHLDWPSPWIFDVWGWCRV
ncbi:PIG-L family deacetylase [Dyella sp. A6]|uniref:PIG-L deacetylase family protein n=1 Tax=Dyella aluminiiresistens TaxID=3069105 RepID=UPI002E769319|nr:PIG-L family deacetylase [Dyella sp. A6]